jgi:hypothetical protein
VAGAAVAGRGVREWRALLLRRVVRAPRVKTAPGRARRRRVRCPRCGWQPDGRPHWQCEVCDARFDTFATRARCPRCPNRWRETQCIACGEMSPHDDWYVDEDGDR